MTDRALTPKERGLCIGAISQCMAFLDPERDTQLYTDLSELRQKLQLTVEDEPDTSNPLAFI